MNSESSADRTRFSIAPGRGKTFFCRSLAWTTLFAATTALAGPITPVIPEVAHPLPLSAVRLTGGPLKNAQELDAKELLALEPDRMLYYFRVRAGLEPKASQGYGGWDGDGRQLTGHIAGHYLSAVSYMYAATGDPRFKERVDYIVEQLKEVQDKQGDGYIGALMGTAPRGGGGRNGGGTNAPASGTNNGGARRRGGDAGLMNGKALFEELAQGTIRSGGFDLNGMWSPWYVEHKIFAGLRDAYRMTGNRMALEVEIKFAGWVDGILSKLSDDQIQRMLATEFGGMNEVMVDLYADTGDPRWLKASDYFEHHRIVDPLAQHRDILGGTHGNTQVPKLLGELARYIYTGNTNSGSAAKFFWEQVVYHHTFATGGHGYDEYFGPPDKLSSEVDGSGQRSQDLRTCESCNVYNMVKMTRMLFAIEPEEKYAAFQERALFNHVLASIDPTAGWTCYMVPIGRGVTHEYERNMLNGGFSCCFGTGLENHGLHGDGIYYESGNKLWVNIYAPSTAEWKSQGVSLAMDTGFPLGDAATLKLTLGSPKELTLALRRPEWAGAGFSVKINGVEDKIPSEPGSYVELKRTWKSGDTVSLVLPKTLHEEAVPDNPRRVALMWGPLVLAGDLGSEQGRGRGRGNARPEAPVLVAADRPVADWLKPVAGEPDTFSTDHVGHDNGTNKDVVLKPFYLLARRTYAVYFDLFTPQEWQQKESVYLAEQQSQEKLNAATVSFAQPGQMQPERDYNFQGEGASLESLEGHDGRRSTAWFSFDLPVEPAHPMKLVVTYSNHENAARHFDILVDGQRLAQQTVEGGTPVKFNDVEYTLPADLVKGKQKVTVRFQAAEGSEVAAVFGLRIVRADAEH